ncbi:flavin-containing monooxygenase [Streptomyces sp. NPDC057199]|uniref:flavin-containing monooxygenase n=1 Tax=Streptomyces sp. NPDC057199 TaxID=3346047 RepID=UPI00363FE22F
MSIKVDRDYQGLLGLDFDPVALTEKYRVERERRIRPDGNRQYVKVAGEFSRFFERNFEAEPVVRERLRVDADVVVIGGGFAGLQTAARLREAGFENFHLIDRNPDFGGNWYFNRYPGAACDTESYVYYPFLEETGYIPSHRFTPADEIQAHARRIASHFGLYEKSLLQTTVTSSVWDEQTKRWTVETDRGDVIRTRFVVLAGGESVASPKLPGIPGINGYKGYSFHSARWDYAYTGGSVHGGLERLRDKRVAIIGTGCSAVQIIPHLGAAAERLYVFQRTPAVVAPRNNHATAPDWAAALKPGWHEKLMWNLNALMEGHEGAEPVADSGFGTQIAAIGALGMRIGTAAHERGIELSTEEVLELSNMAYMESIRAHVASMVEDPKTAEALKPCYASWCKRTAWSDEYYPTFNRPNVTLVDVPLGVERITEKGVVAGGTEYEVDLIVFASGFEASNPSVWELVRFPLVGRNGVSLNEYWSDEFRTMHGMMVANFPNYLQLTLMGTGLGANYLYGSGNQARHVAWIVKHCLYEGITAIEPTKDAEDAWWEEIVRSQGGPGDEVGAAMKKFRGECTPSYFNSDGEATHRKGIMTNIHAKPLTYFQILEEWRTGELRGLKVDRR